MATKPTIIRTKSLRIKCSEEDALSIVIPFVNITAYCLSITTNRDMPDLVSFQNSVASAKTRLASLMGNQLQRAVDFKNLNGFQIDVVACGGYFKISLSETIAAPINTRQSFNVTLMCSTTCSLIDKMMQITKFKNNLLTSKEVANLTVKEYMKLGL